MTFRTFLSVLALWIIFSLPNKLQAQDPYFALDQQGMSSFLDDIFCNYEVGVSEGELSSFVGSLLVNITDPCSPLVPLTTNSTNNSHSFEWNEVPTAKQYTLALFGLSDGVNQVFNTTKLTHDYYDLSPQTYLMIFLTDCVNGSSLANIIISDKDVFYPVSNDYEEGACSCIDNKDEEVSISDECPLFTQFYFPWDNDQCFGNKYSFKINIPLLQEDREFWLLHSDTGADQDQFVHILHCSDGYIEHNDNGTAEYVHEPDNFWAHFNANGVHVYIINEAWTNVTVSAAKCECYDNVPNNDHNDVKGRLAADKEKENIISAWPNPTKELVNIKLQSQSQGSASLYLMGVNGKKEMTKSIHLKKGENNLELDVSHLSSGVFHLIILKDGLEQIQRLVKI